MNAQCLEKLWSATPNLELETAAVWERNFGISNDGKTSQSDALERWDPLIDTKEQKASQVRKMQMEQAVPKANQQ